MPYGARETTNLLSNWTEGTDIEMARDDNTFSSVARRAGNPSAESLLPVIAVDSWI